MKLSRTGRKIPVAMAAFTLFLAMGLETAQAQSLDIPSHGWGLSFGNSKEFTGLRFNFRDSQVKRITGINITLWQPHKDNTEAVVEGLSLGLVPGGAHLRGLQVGLLGVAATKSLAGISFGLLGMGAGGDVTGLNLGGLGIGAGRDMKGINVGGLGIGAGGNLWGLNLGGVGAGENAAGINIGGLGAGAGKNMIGLNIAGLGLGAGERLAGINIGGLGMGAGDRLAGLTIVGLAAGAPEVVGLTIAGGFVGGKSLRGLQVAGAMVHVIKDGHLAGCAVSPFNYIRGSQSGLSIGIVNYARSVTGLQIGVINIVRNNPKGLRVLPVFNTNF